MNPPAPAPMPSTVMTLDGAFALLPKDEMAARGAFAALYDAVVDEQDASAQMLAAAGVLLCVASEFADFRGLATWLERFASGDRAAGLLWPRPHDQARIAAARLTVPLLDEAQGTDDAVVAAAAERLTGLLAGPLAVSPDERILLSKVLIDYRAHRSDTTAVMRIAAQVQDFIRSGGVSPAWQARWWLLMASNHEYFGAADAAADALARANHLSQSHALHQLRYELLCVEMNNALKTESWARADLISREIEKAFADIRAGRLPAGLRAQAARLLWMREPVAALQRLERLLAVCDDIEVPLRDRGAYMAHRAYALMALERFDDAVIALESQRPYQRGEQGEILEVLIDLAGGLGDVRQGRPGGKERLCDAVRRCVPLQFEHFLLPLPDLAAEVAQTALEAAVEIEFVTRLIRVRKLMPSDPSWLQWPWRLQ